MALLKEAIPVQNWEQIRDQIGAILKLEIEEQKNLQSPSVPILDKDPRVFIDRLVPLDKSELPAINIFMDSGTFDKQDVESVDGLYTFNIDFYNKASFGSSAEDDRGDQRSLNELQRLMGICRGIIQAAQYQTLGFTKPSVTHRMTKGIEITDPTKTQDGANMAHGRLILEVRHIETNELFVATDLAESFTKVKLYDTDKGYEWNFVAPLQVFEEDVFEEDVFE